jgi:hypothetical protein
MTHEDVVEEYDVEMLIEHLAKALADQIGTRAKATAAATERAARLQALATLVTR